MAGERVGRYGRWVFCWLVAIAIGFCGPAHALVISEIHYNPPLEDQTLEFIELTNNTDAPDDLSGWAFVRGIQFVFPEGTIVLPQARIVVCADVATLRERYDIDNAVGNFTGRLDASGERLTLIDHAGIIRQSVRFNDSGKWPVEPDGTGHTLILRSTHLDPAEPESWTRSPELGGSPGRANTLDEREPVFDDFELLSLGAEWRFARGTAPFSDPLDAWHQLGFDDSFWDAGPSPFGYSDITEGTILDDMRNNYTSIAIRTRLIVSQEDLDAPGDFFLGMLFDDGFCAFLNGVELTNSRCPEELLADAVATRSHEARSEALFLIDRNRLQVGENELSIAGFNRSLNGNDFVLGPRVFRRVRVADDSVDSLPVHFNELYRSTETGGGWVELFNSSNVEIDLSGLRLTDDPDHLEPYAFPDNVRLAPGDFLILREDETGLGLSEPRVRLFLLDPESGGALSAVAFTQEPFDDLTLGSYSEGSVPDGGRAGWVTETLTPGSANEVPRVEDIVINEIFYHPPENRLGEFIELYNRGENAVDVSGFHFSKGIDCTLPENTTIPAAGYLVLAERPELLTKHYGLQGAIKYEGQLADGGENVRLVDRLGNLVDEVRYYDGGRWSPWADGGGASLELIDPNQGNDFGPAWEASDEAEKTEWEQITYSALYQPFRETELHLFLVEKGICRVDDVSVTKKDETENHIPNPGFEKDTRPWRIEGTHVHSKRTTEDSHSGEASLEVIATGKGDSSCNRIEIDANPRMRRQEYEVSLWARWLRGSSLLITHGGFSKGRWFGTRDTNMSTNSLGARHRLTVPHNIGTPGNENSARRNLRAETGNDNLGPVITDVRHDPLRPGTDNVVSVHARVFDSDGIGSVTAFSGTDSTRVEFSSTELFDDGQHGDGLPGDGHFAGQIGNFQGRVVFYVEAVDRLGTSSRFPTDAPSRSCIFSADNRDERLHFMSDRNHFQELSRRRLHSNDLLDATVIFDDKAVYYNAGVRFRGSPWGRPSRHAYRIRFPKDKPYIGGLTSINVTNRDRVDGAAYFMIRRLGTPESPAPAADYRYIRASFNDQRLGTPGIYDPVDRTFIEKWYGPAAAKNAVVLKGIGRLRFSDACERTGWDEATLLHMDDVSENYRFYWFHSIHQTRDNWKPYMALTRLIHAVPLEELDRDVASMIDLEAFFRTLGARVLLGDGDALFIGNGHNGYVVWDPTDGRWEYLPFDNGGAFSSTGNLFSFRDAGVRRLAGRPLVRRAYLRVMEQALQGYWSAKATPYLTALSRTTGNGGNVPGFLRSSSSSLARQIRRTDAKELIIVTNDGEDFEAPKPQVQLEGAAPVRLTDFFVQRGNGELEHFEPTFSKVTRWNATFDLDDGLNELHFFGTDRNGTLYGPASITIAHGTLFRRGDVNANGRINASDAFEILRVVFGGSQPDCADAADINDDGILDVTDALALVRYLFLRGDPPALPFVERGQDPTTDDKLGCVKG